MKVTYTFDESDQEDMEERKIFEKSREMLNALYNVDAAIRKRVKNDSDEDPISESEQRFHDEIFEIISESGYSELPF